MHPIHLPSSCKTTFGADSLNRKGTRIVERRGGGYFKRTFAFEAIDLYNYKTGCLETTTTSPYIHCACSDAIYRCLVMLPVATVVDKKIRLRFRAFVIVHSPKFKRYLKRTNHKGRKPSRKFRKSSSPSFTL